MLHIAASSTSPQALDVVAVLIKAGADISTTDFLKRTPIHIAAMTGNGGVLKKLVLLGGGEEEEEKEEMMVIVGVEVVVEPSVWWMLLHNHPLFHLLTSLPFQQQMSIRRIFREGLPSISLCQVVIAKP